METSRIKRVSGCNYITRIAVVPKEHILGDKTRSDMARKRHGFIVGIEIDLVVVWVVEIDLISVWGIGIELI